MAEREIRRLLESLAARHPCLAAKVIHRIGIIPVGETAIYVGVAVAAPRGSHRLAGRIHGSAQTGRADLEAAGVARCAIGAWPGQPQPVGRTEVAEPAANLSAQTTASQRPALRSLDEAIAEIHSRCQPLPPSACRWPSSLAACCARPFARRKICRRFDRSTRDGYAILTDDASEEFSVRGHDPRRRLETAPAPARRSRPRGHGRGAAVRRPARGDAGARGAQRRQNPDHKARKWR